MNQQQQQPESLKRKRIDLAQQYYIEKNPYVIKPISRSLLAEFDAAASVIPDEEVEKNQCLLFRQMDSSSYHEGW